LFSGIPCRAASPISIDVPVTFFTNFAARLVHEELNLDLNHIQIYPTNQYAPAVHRLLQVAANLYDAATNRDVTSYPNLPSVFRPVFAATSNEVFINGYEEVTNLDVLALPLRDASEPDDRSNLGPHDMVYGVPLVIGARKGFPNFNEFGMQNDIRVTRQLKFHREIAGGPVTQTNQSYVIGISNALGVEAWNSYNTNFSRPLQMTAAADVIV
jgi:hypothetical protein